MEAPKAKPAQQAERAKAIDKVIAEALAPAAKPAPAASAGFDDIHFIDAMTEGGVG
ncbi:hypothetical protein [Blastomonas sp. AAP53]|uniref:hypothetical protein n=1 Tax=Blastomonas sp. AAP53 TaxID=1248760 RepID=UPI0002F2DEC0|nr:hypothetical protein [Blastomonas sp. AAP53]